ncbi:uncharacterized protein LOC134841879 isoform X2 [Symsagittifera roscoffensis]|uniref:uncharacterized protein LOC134841879 isoform X2 n=1 Tax=Symsagittifera roscoffensis TaxID=84072 RepID=UPI00307B3067
MEISESEKQSKMMEMNNLLEGTTPLMRSGESSLGSSSHNLVMGFDGIFRSEKCVKLFQDFLKEQNQVNYLMFWLAVNGYKKVPEPSKADHLAKIIYRSFIKSNSENPVKLNSTTIHDIKSLMETAPIVRTIFDNAHLEVETLLRTQFYPQFTKWEGASKFEFVDNSPTIMSSENPTSQANTGTHFGFHDSSPANTGSVSDVTVPTNPNVSMSSNSAIYPPPPTCAVQSATKTTTTVSAGLNSASCRCQSENTSAGSLCGATSSSCLMQECEINNNNSDDRFCGKCDSAKSEANASNNLLTCQQPQLSSSKGNPHSTRLQRRGKSQENTIDHRVNRDITIVKLGHHSRPKSSTANNNNASGTTMATSATTAGNKKSSSGATKAELAARKAPEMLSPHQFAAILTRKLEELQIKQQGFKLETQNSICSSSSHERCVANKLDSLVRHQLLAVSGASSQQVSDRDLPSSSQEDDPNNIIDSHVSRVFRDTRDCSPSPSYSPTPLCANHAIHSKSSCNTMPGRVVTSHTGGCPGTNSGKLLSSGGGSRKCNRFETCSNLSVSSGVDSGCFDVSSQFSTDSRESERSRLSVINWMQTSSRENSGSTHSTRNHILPPKQHPGGLIRGSSTTSRVNNRWASLSPHRNMHYSVNNNLSSGNCLAPAGNNVLLHGCMTGGAGTPSRVPPLLPSHCALSNNCINNSSAINHQNSGTQSQSANLHSSVVGSATSICACGRDTSAVFNAMHPSNSYIQSQTQYHQKKSRSNSAERPFSGAALQVFNAKLGELLPKATTSESIIGMTSSNCSQDNVCSAVGNGTNSANTFAPPSFSQSAGSKTPKLQKESVIAAQFADSTPISEKKKSWTWSKQRSSEKSSRHINNSSSCSHHQSSHGNQSLGSAMVVQESMHVYTTEIQEDSAFDESCAEESYFSTCSTGDGKKSTAVVSSQGSVSGSNPTSQPHSSSASQVAGGGNFSGSSSVVTTTTNNSGGANCTVVAYYFCGEQIPYRTVVQSKVITLSDFKSLLTRKGNYRYFFKMRSDEIELGGIVNEEVTDDNAILPFYDGKIIGRIEKQPTLSS